jgi:peroxiredoxin
MIFLLLLTLAASPPQPAEKAPLSLMSVAHVGDAAPMFGLPVLNTATTAKQRFGLERYVGKYADVPRRAVVLSFGASYCEPCERELPLLRSMHAELTGAGVELAVVVVDHEKDGIEKMRKLTVDQLRLPYPVLSDEFRIVSHRYDAETLPFLAIVDANGVLRWVHAGFSPDIVATLKSELTKVGVTFKTLEPPPKLEPPKKKMKKKMQRKGTR